MFFDRNHLTIRLYRKCSGKLYGSTGCGPPRWISDNDYYFAPNLPAKNAPTENKPTREKSTRNRDVFIASH
ncbi:MAG: hypothetical protein BECKG1743F_GA0114225_106434, partial [Candidatus Kentron sp. G]